VGVDLGLIKKSGAWYEYEGEKLGQGKEATRTNLKANKKLRDEIEQKIRKLVKEKQNLPLQVGSGSAAGTSKI